MQTREGPLLDNPLWQCACRLYAVRGVAETCLALQEEFALDVNLLLWAVWIDTRGVALGQEDVSSAHALVAAWHAEGVGPLRGARRAIKAMKLVERTAIAVLRADIQALELRAEQIELALLFEWSERRWPASGPIDATNLARNVSEVLLRAGVVDAARRQSSADVIADAARSLHG